MRLARAGSKSGRVLERRRSERVDSMLDDPEVDQELARRRSALRRGLYVPLRRRATGAIGVIAAHDKRRAPTRASPTTTCGSPRRSPRAPRSPSTSPSASRATRSAASSSAQELERRRLARELHDETGQALTSILLGLKRARGGRGDDERRAAVAERCASSSSQTLQDVRRLAVELRPKALDDFGLVPALERLARDVRASRRASRSTSSRTLGDEPACRPRSRPRSTGSSRRR